MSICKYAVQNASWDIGSSPLGTLVHLSLGTSLATLAWALATSPAAAVCAEDASAPPNVTCAAGDANGYFSMTDVQSITVDPGVRVDDSAGTSTGGTAVIGVLDSSSPIPGVPPTPGVAGAIVNNGTIASVGTATAPQVAVHVEGSVGGGIVNTGAITGPRAGIQVVGTVGGDIINTATGLIETATDGIEIRGNSVSGRFVNDGTIRAGGAGFTSFTAVSLGELSGDFRNNGTIESIGATTSTAVGVRTAFFHNVAGATISSGDAGVGFNIPTGTASTAMFVNDGVIRAGGAAVTGAAGNFINRGRIAGGDFAGGFAAFNGFVGLASVNSFLNEAAGTINSAGTLGNSLAAVTVRNLAKSFVNRGTINGGAQAGVAILHNNPNAIFMNSGNISGGTSGVEILGNAVVTSLASLENSGAITGNNAAIRVGGIIGGDIVNTGTLTGNMSGLEVRRQQPGSVINTGTITGDIGVFFGLGITNPANDDRLVNSGTITGTGGTAIDFKAGNDIFSHDASTGTINGIVDGGDDADTFNLTGGAFDLTGTLVNFEQYNVQNGATGFGAGTMNGNLAVAAGGTLAPGASIGTMSVIGNLALATGSTLAIEIDAANNADRIDVSGTTTLGGTLQVSALGMMSAFPTANHYDIIESAGGITGAFGAVTDNLPDLDLAASIVNGGKTVRLNLVGATPTTTPTGLSDKSIYPNTLQASGHSARVFAETLQRRAQLGTLPEQSNAVLGYTALFGGTGTEAAFSTFDTAAPVYSAWTGVFGSHVDVDTSMAATGYAADLAGFAIGVEGLFETESGAFIRAGVAGGHSRSGIGSGLSSADADILHAGLYGSVEHGPLIASGAFSYGLVDYGFNRVIPITGMASVAASGDSDGDTFAASLAASWDISPALGLDRPNGLRVAPIIRFDHVSADLDGYNETGAGILNQTVSGSGWDRSWAGAGIQVSAAFETQTGVVVKSELELRYEHAFGDGNANVFSDIASVAGATFTSSGAREGDKAIAVGAGINIDFSETVSARVRYDGAFSNDSDNHRASGGLTIKF